MDESKIDKIKTAVRRNFDDSPASYERLEAKYGFFRKLNEMLLSRMTVPEGSRILDVGCGTGIVSFHLLDAVPNSTVVGLDNSAAMLDAARARVSDDSRISFVEGDAARLGEYFSEPFDAIVYSASIFLIPDYRESLLSARDLLSPGGKIGVTFMDGLYDAYGRNALALAEQQAGVGVSVRKPVNLPQFHADFREIFPLERSWHEDMMPGKEMLLDFFLVPAMSAGLFPGLPYEERAEKVTRLFGFLPTTSTAFRWAFLVGETRS